MTPEAIAGQATVQRWFASAHYDEDPEEERQHRLALLAEFCDHIGESPDELIAGLLRTTKDGDTAIRAKRREAVNTAIEEFVEKRGDTGREAVVSGNSIRGFMVHNGIMIQGRVWRCH
ncbi:MAG: hypothetical protein ACRD0C_09655 [Acidimicrobiia bacterium]